VTPPAGPPTTLVNAATARARLIVWCKECRHQVEPDPAAMAERYGAATTVPEWHEPAVLAMPAAISTMVVTGAKAVKQPTAI
jgi:hypothetical protein